MLAFKIRNFLLFVSLIFLSNISCAGQVEIHDSQLFVDGKAQPQLFGAEVQYFRLRGGTERNIPRAKVLALWAQALDRIVEAKMNAVSFYIPWDFHEYAQGKFDFDGTVDEDGDGLPDYPSRDVKTFIKMIEERGIKNIMVRPGPYVNAEWGFLGFGAVPQWFHEKFPESHMQNSSGLRTKLYDYTNTDLLKYTQLYFAELYKQVLKPNIGPNKIISFLQLDNETNYMWQSIYNHDYSPNAVARYREFLKTQYPNLAALNSRYQNSYKNWDDVQAPKVYGANVAEDQDWYRFADDTIYVYLQKVRKIWEDIGVHEPDVMFTLADSYNATQNGLLPNFKLHSMPGKTGLLTVNMYPKTYETGDHPLLNLPFKADHDVKSAEAASEFYLGKGGKWALGPEIQGGWWRGIEVTPEARLQTYLTVIGHGLKALFVYYFNEGDNWGYEWSKKQIEPIYEELRSEPAYKQASEPFSPGFWQELQSRVDHRVLAGFDAQAIMHQSKDADAKLYFDAPLDHDAQPRNHFFQLKEIGEKVVAPYGAWLAKANEVTDPVCLIKDVADHVPSLVPGVDNVQLNSDWAAGLIAYAMRSGINVKMIMWGMTPDSELQSCKLILRQDHGDTSVAYSQSLKNLINQGATLINFIDDSLAGQIGVSTAKISTPHLTNSNFAPASFANNADLTLGANHLTAETFPLFHYNSPLDPRCSEFLKQDNQIAGYHCIVGQGHFYQIGAVFYDIYNSNQYALQNDLPDRELFLQKILTSLSIKPQIHTNSNRVVAFARKAKDEPRIWITVKSASNQNVSSLTQVQDVQPDQTYVVRNLMEGGEQHLKGSVLKQTGFSADLKAFGSNVFVVDPEVKPDINPAP